MRVGTFRLLDRFVGVPACAALTVVRRLRGGRRGPAAAVRKILFLKLVEQGSTVLARPAFEAAAARVGRENVYCLTLVENRGILDLMGLIPEENVIAVPGGSPATVFSGLLRAVCQVRRLGIDAVVDLEFFARATAVIAFLTGAPVRAGLHPGPGAGPWRGDLLTHRVLYQADLHTSQLYEVLVRALDAPGDTLPTLFFPPPAPGRWRSPFFVPTAADLQLVRGLLGPGGGDAPRLFLLNPNAGDLVPLRRWPEEHYEELARRILAGDAGAVVAFTGTAAEAAATDRLAVRVASPRCLSLAGRTTLRELLILAALADAVVSNDSGTVHFASLTSARIVALFGPETARRFGPLSAASETVSLGLACSPCLSAYNNRSSSCRDNRCMQGIPVDAVLGAVHRLLSERP